MDLDYVKFESTLDSFDKVLLQYDQKVPIIYFPREQSDLNSNYDDI